MSKKSNIKGMREKRKEKSGSILPRRVMVRMRQKRRAG
jgi:hypothetical protein